MPRMPSTDDVVPPSRACGRGSPPRQAVTTSRSSPSPRASGSTPSSPPPPPAARRSARTTPRSSSPSSAAHRPRRRRCTSSVSCRRTRSACSPVWSTCTRPSTGRAGRRDRQAGARRRRCSSRSTRRGEPGKGGCPLADVAALVDAGRRRRSRRARPDDRRADDRWPARRPDPASAPCAPLVDELGLTMCSMGMSDDLEVAVEEGSHAGAHRQRAVRCAPVTLSPRPQRDALVR